MTLKIYKMRWGDVALSVTEKTYYDAVMQAIEVLVGMGSERHIIMFADFEQLDKV